MGTLDCILDQGGNEHMETNGPPSGVRPCLQDGAGRHRIQTQDLALSLRPLGGLAEIENPACEAVKREAEEDWPG